MSLINIKDGEVLFRMLVDGKKTIIANEIICNSDDSFREIWPTLSDDNRDWLVESQLVREVFSDFHCVDFKRGKDQEGAISFPEFTIVLKTPCNGPLLRVSGWCAVGTLVGGEIKERYQYCGVSGRPIVHRWTLKNGENMRLVDTVIPVWFTKTGWVTANRTQLQQCLNDAIDSMDCTNLKLREK